MSNRMSIYLWIFGLCLIGCVNGNDHEFQNIQEDIEKLTEQSKTRSKTFLQIKSKLEVDMDEIKEFNRINNIILKNFQKNQLNDLILDITNSSNLEKIIEKQEHDLKVMTTNLSKIIEDIMEIDSKLDTWNGSPNEIFNEFEMILDFIPIGFLSIFILFIVLKLIVAVYINSSDDSMVSVNLVKSEALQTHDNQPVAANDYERPIEYPEQKNLDLTIDRKRESIKKKKHFKEQQKFSSKCSNQNQNKMDNDEKPVIFGVLDEGYY